MPSAQKVRPSLLFAQLAALVVADLFCPARAGQAECLDYLLEVAVKMKLAGMETVGLQQ